MIYFITFIILCFIFLLLILLKRKKNRELEEQFCYISEIYRNNCHLFGCRHSNWLECICCKIKYPLHDNYGCYIDECPLCEIKKYVHTLEHNKTKIHESRLREYKKVEEYLKYLRTF